MSASAWLQAMAAQDNTNTAIFCQECMRRLAINPGLSCNHDGSSITLPINQRVKCGNCRAPNNTMCVTVQPELRKKTLQVMALARLVPQHTSDGWTVDELVPYLKSRRFVGYRVIVDDETGELPLPERTPEEYRDFYECWWDLTGLFERSDRARAQHLRAGGQ